MTVQAVDGRSMPLRERKKLRTRRVLADAALRMFTEKSLDAVTVEDLAEAADVSKSTFFRFFPAKEAAAIEAMTSGCTSWPSLRPPPSASPVATGYARAGKEAAAP